MYSTLLRGSVYGCNNIYSREVYIDKLRGK